MKQLLIVLGLMTTLTSFASRDYECGVAMGLSISAESMTAYGTSEHFYTNAEFAGGVAGTKERQVEELLKKIIILEPNLPEMGKYILEEARFLKAGLINGYSSRLSDLNREIDAADSSLKSFARAMKNLCRQN